MKETVIDFSERRRLSQLRKIQLAEAAHTAIVFGVIGEQDAKIISFKKRNGQPGVSANNEVPGE